MVAFLAPLAAFLGSGTVAAGLTKVAIGVGLSVLGNLLSTTARSQGTGSAPEITLEGESTPRQLAVGRFYTAGFVPAPYYAFDKYDQGIPNDTRVQIRVLADAPISGISKVWVDKTEFDVTDDLIGSAAITGAGMTPNGSTRPEWAGSNPELFVAWTLGGQTVASSWLVSEFGAHSERPWGADRIGTGLAYAYTGHKANDEVYGSEPDVHFEGTGAPVYDRRLDGSEGGTGAHRAGDTSTWEYADNALTLAMAVIAGYPVGPDKTSVGYDWSDMDYAEWTAEQDECDVLVDGQPKYRAGYIANLKTQDRSGETAIDIARHLLKAANAEVADVAGKLHVRIGGPDLPIATITDDDIVVSNPQEYEPVRSRTDRHNAVRVSHRDPDQRWAMRPSPLRKNDEAVTLDGELRVAPVTLEAVWDEAQAQRIGQGLVEDDQRQRAHIITLDAYYDFLHPLTSLAWTSVRNNYQAKVFEVERMAVDPDTQAVTLAIRERDPDDYDPDITIVPPEATSSQVVSYADFPLPGFGVQAITITNADGSSSKPGIRITWTAGLAGIKDVEFQVRREGQTDLAADGTTAADTGIKTVSDGILATTVYEVRARGLGQKTAWTAWTDVTTTAGLLGADDIDVDSILADLEAATAIAQAAADAAQAAADEARADLLLATGDIGDLQTEAADIVDRLGSLEFDTATLSTDTAAIQDDVDAIVSDLSNIDLLTDGLQTDLDGVVSDLSSLDLLTDGLQDDLDTLQSMVGNVQTDIEAIDYSLDLKADDVSTTDALQAADDVLTDLALLVQGQSQAFTDIGVSVDPETGRYVMWSTQGTNQAISDVRVDLDGINATLSLTATTAYVNQAVSDAVLDPSQIPIVDDLEAAISAVELELDGFNASLTAKADLTTVDGHDVEITQAQLDIDALEQTIVLKVDTTTFEGVEARVSEAEITLSTIEGASITTLVQDVSMLAESTEALEAATVGGLLAAYEATEYTTQAVAYVREDVHALVEEGRSATASVRQELGVQFSNAVSLIETEKLVRVAEDEALASITEVLDSRVTDTETGLEGQGTAVSLLQTEVTNIDGTLTSVSADVVALDTRLTTAEGETAANATANETLETRISETETDISAISTSVLDLESALDATEAATAANATANQVVETRVSETEDDISALAADVTTLSAGLGDVEGEITQQADAIQVLQVQTTLADDSAESIAQAVTELALFSESLFSSASANVSATFVLDGRITETEDGIELQASQITDLGIELDDVENNVAAQGSAIQVLQTTITQQGDNLTVISADVTELESRLTTNEGETDANATATTALAALVTSVEGVNTSQASDITTLTADLGGAESDIAAIESVNQAQGTAISGLQTTITQQGGDITVLSGELTELESSLVINEGATAANATAIDGIETQVSSINGELTSQASQLTTLEADLTANEGATTANAGAISGLDTRVTVTEDETSALAADVTTLSAGLGDVEGEITQQADAIQGLQVGTTLTEDSAEAIASSVTDLALFSEKLFSSLSANVSATFALDGRITETEDGIEATAMQVTDLSVAIGGANEDIDAQGSAIQVLQTTASQQGDVIDVISADVTELGARLTINNGLITATAGAVSGLETRVTSAEGELTSQSLQLTELEADLTTVEGGVAANASATSALDALVTSVEGVNTSQASDITTLTADLGDAQTDINAAQLTNAAQGLAINGLQTTVTQQGEDISILSIAQTELEADLVLNEDATAANAGAITTTQASVATVDGRVDSVASDVAQLDTGLTINNGLTTATAGAVSALETRVTINEDDIVVVSQDITTLEGSINDAVLTIDGVDVIASGNALAIDSLQTEVSTNGNSISSQALQISALETDVETLDGGKASVSAVNSVLALSEANEDGLTALGGTVSTLEARVDAGAFYRSFDFSEQTLDGLTLGGTGASVAYGTTTDSRPTQKDFARVTFGSGGEAILQFDALLSGMRGKAVELQVRLDPSTANQTLHLDVFQREALNDPTYSRVLQASIFPVPNFQFTHQILRVDIPDDEKVTYAIRLRLSGPIGATCRITDFVLRDGSVDVMIAGIQNIQTVQADATSALADDLDIVSADLGDVGATVTTQGLAVVDLESDVAATALLLTEVEATAGDNAATVTTQGFAVADLESDVGAISTLLNEVEATAGDAFADASIALTAVADLEGNQSSSLVFAATAGGAVSSLELVAADNPGGPVTSAIRFTSDLTIFDSNEVKSSDFIAGEGGQGWLLKNNGRIEAQDLVVYNSMVAGNAITGSDDFRTFFTGAGPHIFNPTIVADHDGDCLVVAVVTVFGSASSGDTVDLAIKFGPLFTQHGYTVTGSAGLGTHTLLGGGQILQGNNTAIRVEVDSNGLGSPGFDVAMLVFKRYK